MLIQAKIAVTKTCVTETITKFELWPESGAITFRRESRVVISDQSIDGARISERQFAAWIDVPNKASRNRLPTFVARVVCHQDGAGSVYDAIDYPRTAFDQHDHDWLAGGLDGFG